LYDVFNDAVSIGDYIASKGSISQLSSWSTGLVKTWYFISWSTNSPHFMGVSCRIHDSPPLVTIPSQSNPVSTITSCFFNTGLNISFPSTPECYKQILRLSVNSEFQRTLKEALATGLVGLSKTKTSEVSPFPDLKVRLSEQGARTKNIRPQRKRMCCSKRFDSPDAEPLNISWEAFRFPFSVLT